MIICVRMTGEKTFVRRTDYKTRKPDRPIGAVYPGLTPWNSFYTKRLLFFLSGIFFKVFFFFLKTFSFVLTWQTGVKTCWTSISGGVSSNRKPDTRSNRHSGSKGTGRAAVGLKAFRRNNATDGLAGRIQTSARFRDYLQTHALVVCPRPVSPVYPARVSKKREVRPPNT